MPTVNKLRSEFQVSTGYINPSDTALLNFAVMKINAYVDAIYSMVERINALEARPTARTLSNIRVIMAYARGMMLLHGGPDAVPQLAAQLQQAELDLQDVEWQLDNPPGVPAITACPFCGETAHPSGAEVPAKKYKDER